MFFVLVGRCPLLALVVGSLVRTVWLILCPVAVPTASPVVASVIWWFPKLIVRSQLPFLSFLTCYLGRRLDSEKERLEKEIRLAEESILSSEAVAREAADRAQDALSKVRESLARVSRLRRQRGLLESREHGMIANELASIEEFESLETSSARASQSSALRQGVFLDDLLPSGPDFDQIDWAGFADDNALPSSSNS